MISCSVAVDPLKQIRGSIIDIINIQRCCKEMKLRSEAYRWLKSMDQMGPGLSSGLEGRAWRGREREGEGSFGNKETL